MTKYELLNLVRDLTETIKTNSNTMEALTFQIRDFQADADILKGKVNQYINRNNWVSKKYIQLQKTVKANVAAPMSQEDFDNLWPTSEEEIN